MDKINAAKERVKGTTAENLKMIDNVDMAREYQRRSVEARKKNQERMQMVKDMMKDLKSIGTDVEDMPKGIDMMRWCMVQAMQKNDLEMVADIANKIAAFETPKLAAQQVTQVDVDLKDLSEEEFEKLKKEAFGGKDEI